MTCFAPLNAWQRAKGTPPIFSPPSRPDSWTKLQLPCSQCIGCRIERSRQWASRCIHEASLHRDNCFVTLTYDEENVPHGGTLVRPHFQKWMKRFRRRIEGKIRYYMCGEYGELGRPHYHAIIFGYDFQDKEIWKVNDGIVTYTSAFLEDLWPFGFSTVSDVTWQSAAYVSRYVLKKITGKEAQEHYETIDFATGEIINREPEYSSMSLKPAIGADWFATYKRDCFPKDFVTHNGRKFRIPRYYDELLRRQSEEAYQAIKAKRRKKALERRADNTTKRLKTKQAVCEARLTSRKLQ